MTIPILLLMLGLALIIVELMFPSMGLLGVAAALCLIAAIAVAFTRGSTEGVTFLVATALGVPLAIWGGFKLIPLSPARKLLVNEGPTFKDIAAVDPRDRALLGQVGHVESLLRPSGVALIGGRRVDVVTRGEAIEAGARVRVVELEGNRVVVAAVETNTRAPSA